VSPIFPSLFLTGYLDKVDKGLQGLWLWGRGCGHTAERRHPSQWGQHYHSPLVLYFCKSNVCSC